MPGRGQIDPIVLSEENAKDVEYVAEPSPDMPTKRAGAGATILLIEDEHSLRALLREALEQAGYEVVEAPDGRVGLELYRSAPTDLVITDIIMPERDGLDTTLALIREFSDAKVIAMSGAQGKQNLLDVAKLFGARRTLQKPFSLAELVDAVRQELGQSP